MIMTYGYLYVLLLLYKNYVYLSAYISFYIIIMSVMKKIEARLDVVLCTQTIVGSDAVDPKNINTWPNELTGMTCGC